MKMVIFAVFAAMTTAACAGSSIPARPADISRFSPTMRATFTANQVRSWDLSEALCGEGASPDPSRAWTPDPSLVARIDERLAREVGSRLAAEGESVSEANEFYRQYAGVYCGGTRLVVVEGSRMLDSYVAQRQMQGLSPDTFPWRDKRFFRVSHSGTSFFWASYRTDGRPYRPLAFDCCRTERLQR